MNQYLSFITLAGGLWLLLRWISARSHSRLPLPPGPKPLPIIGNIFDMPQDIREAWKTYSQWSGKYSSDIICLQLPMQPIVILNSVKVAVDLLDKRSHIYSDRMSSVLFEMIIENISFVLMRYGPRWRAHRRAFHQYFNQSASEQYQPIQLNEIRAFLCWVLKSPKETRAHVRRLTTSLILRIAYGMRIAGLDDDYVQIAESALRGSSEGISMLTFFLAEWVPFAGRLPSWIPGNRLAQLRDDLKPKFTAMRDKPYEFIKAEIAKGRGTPSVAYSLIQKLQTTGNVLNPSEFSEEEDIARNIAAVAYSGGSDTTASAAESFLLAMSLYPEKQKKAQAELDRVVGPHRLPDYHDVKSLVYIQATAMEVMRWMPVTPFAIPHRLAEDDVYNGYLIPKGTVVMINEWAMLHSPEHYPEPEMFNPDRFLNESGGIDPNVVDPNTIAFGFGRRVCPGRHFGNNTLVMFIASVLHVFNIAAGTDESGRTLELSAEILPGFLSRPKDVPHGLTPRTDRAESIVREIAVELEAEDGYQF